MKKHLKEESVLLISISKWFVLASIIGAIVGLSTSLFLFILEACSGEARRFSHYYLLLPAALFFSSLVTKYLAPEAEGHGTEKVVEALHQRSGKIDTLVVPVKLFTTVLTLVAGGSAGKEGPCAQIGGGLASIFADIVRFDDADRKKLVICGISAGFAAVFGTPIAGAMFGVEVLFVGGLLYDVLLPSFIAGVMGYQISAAVGVSYFYHPINFMPAFSELFFIKVVMAGVFFGLCSLLLIESLYVCKRQADRIKLWEPYKGLIGGALLVIMTLLLSTSYLGLGLDTIEEALGGKHIIWYAFAAKIVFTSITLTFGGSGGMVTPIFFIGATVGSLFGVMMGLDPATFAAIGMVSLLAGAANTPIAASILAVELFGATVAPYAAVACVTSFLMTGHRSVYPSQVYAIMKSTSFRGGVGKEVEDAHTEFMVRRKSLTGGIISVFASLRKRLKKRRRP